MGKSVYNATDIGILEDEVYDRYLSKPIAMIRRLLMWSLRKEMPLLKWQQDKLRSRLRDRYFVYSSMLGTHSFFLIFIPMTFWLGSPYFGRGLINVLAFGVYLSSALKDWLCVPRPYSPPVTRLTIGTHHLEYGFPSTHSTNAVSIACYVYLWIRTLRDAFTGGVWSSYLWEAGLLYYVCSVVYGRIYSGMHSIVDCVAGSLLGLVIVLAQWAGFDKIEAFMIRSDWSVPFLVIPIGLLMVSIHPQPLDDCPCFEDAIAFIAVAMGVSVSRWVAANLGVMLVDDHPLNTYPQARTTPVIRLLPNGIFLVILTRLVTKTMCNIILPPIIRFFYETFGLILPRRHYVPATEYNKIPLANLRAVPSILDLPDTLTPTTEMGDDRRRSLLSPDSAYRRNGSISISSPSSSRVSSPGPLHERNAGSKRVDYKPANGSGVPAPITQSRPGSPTYVDPIAEKIAEALRLKDKQRRQEKEKNPVKHYDADVLTKVVVYFSIGFHATMSIPVLFERLGWNGQVVQA
ncbi:PAP2-domain-containing protein [Tilletiaria anomala UBC 951]|uniref:PAP2-domain-containing protein n=1 Tax=Tilletiaria anomala (strain ATCC 24038 / CBS 436.72 / UBC 951) TaxID=1037660 RepID=A0A066WP93_TILAU|nr:PAP2-domain-containing protein [Tilletiaria anomala UBC 951]KDN52435.1 PAP2-domain-containing protein [Tilletiaria anomala UBC 951]